MKDMDKNSTESSSSQQKAEEALRDSEEKYRLLARNLPGTTVFLFDHHLRFILVEGFLHPELNFTTTQLEGKTLWEVLPKERAELLAPIYKNALEGKSTENLISEYKDTCYSTNVLPVRNNQAEIIAGMVVSQNITESKRKEEELQANYSLLRIAGETASLGGWVLNLAENRVIWSDVVAAIHEMPAGYSPDLNEGINFYAPEWRDRIARAIADCAEKGLSFDEELELITAKGKRIWVRAAGKAVRNENGKIVKIQGAFQNIDQRKQAELRQHESEEKYRLLYENMSQGVFYQLADGSLADINPAGLEMLGLTMDQFLGRASRHPDWIVFDEQHQTLPPELYPSMLALTSANDVNGVVGIFNPEKQSFKWINVYAKPQFKPGENKPFQAFVTMHDITERKLNETIISSRLHLVQYAQTHSLDELLEESLNEAEKLTGSQIGFFHLVDENQNYLALQNWSTRTKTMFCKAEGKKSHYPLSEAGVWVDCVSQRKPVIHNNYASLPHRKGMPEGHAHVIRELVVPIIRDGKITAVLGVGNKFNNYVQQDVDALLQLADMAWELAERKRIESALYRSEAIFDQFMEHSPIYIFFKDENIRSLRLSRNFEKMLGKPLDELLGKSMDELFPSGLAKIMIKNDQEVLRDGVKIEVQEELNNRQYSTIKFPIQIEGKSKFLAGFSIDITERTQAEAEILKTKRQYDILVAKIPVGVYILKTDHNGAFALEYASPRMAEMLGLSVEALLSHNEAIFKAIHPDDLEGFARLNLEGIQHKRPFDWKGRIVIKGEVRWMHFSSLPQELETGDILWHGLIVDITDRMRDEAEIKLKNDELQNLNATKDKFFSIIAHDLKNPFNAILGFSNILITQIQEKNYEGIEEYAEIIQNSSQRALELLINLLEWSRSQTGRMEFSPEYIEAVGLINEVVLLMNDSAKQKSIKIINRLPQNLKICADKAMIGNVLRNLISNAIKFTYPEGEIVISAVEGPDELIISVSDNGMGIKKEAIGKLFRIDENYSSRGTQNEKGTGLGLILCREFVEKHGGKIWAESEAGKGSTFSFSVPKR